MQVAPTMQRPLITVLIDTYNYGRFIEEAIDSVLSQGFATEQAEILVVDDGSTDDTAERVKKFGSKVRYIYKPNGGQASAFNMGFLHAAGELVFLLDADDYFLPGKLRRVVQEFQDHPEVGMIYHGLRELDEASGKLRDPAHEFVPVSGSILSDRSKLLSYLMYPTSCLAFRRSALQQIFPVPDPLAIQADAYLTLLIPFLTPVLAIPETFSVYRAHGLNLFHAEGQSLTPKRRQNRFQMHMLVLQEAKAWVGAHKQQVDLAPAKLFLTRASLTWHEDRFPVSPPGRWAFFLFLVRQNTLYRSQQTWRFTTFNYLSAVIALLCGYGRTRNLDKWRTKAIGVFHSMRKRSTGMPPEPPL